MRFSRDGGLVNHVFMMPVCKLGSALTPEPSLECTRRHLHCNINHLMWRACTANGYNLRSIYQAIQSLVAECVCVLELTNCITILYMLHA